MDRFIVDNAFNTCRMVLPLVVAATAFASTFSHPSFKKAIFFFSLDHLKNLKWCTNLNFGFLRVHALSLLAPQDETNHHHETLDEFPFPCHVGNGWGDRRWTGKSIILSLMLVARVGTVWSAHRIVHDDRIPHALTSLLSHTHVLFPASGGLPRLAPCSPPWCWNVDGDGVGCR
jgi:hypothetical protein